jgi:hypothetical protein
MKMILYKGFSRDHSIGTHVLMIKVVTENITIWLVCHDIITNMPIFLLKVRNRPNSFWVLYILNNAILIPFAVKNVVDVTISIDIVNYNSMGGICFPIDHK